MKNISRDLINGMIGEVVQFKADGPCVNFEGKLHVIKPQTFQVFSRERGQNIAQRIQLPLRLAYGMTIHKSQGLTLQQVEVDCSHITQPGQLGVAIGRVNSLSGLRVVNYTSKSVRPA